MSTGKKERAKKRANAKQGPNRNRYGEITEHPFRNVAFSHGKRNRKQRRQDQKSLGHESEKFDEHAEAKTRRGSAAKNRKRKVITASRRGNR